MGRRGEGCGRRARICAASVDALVSMVRVRVQQRWACEGEERKKAQSRNFSLPPGFAADRCWSERWLSCSYRAVDHLTCLCSCVQLKKRAVQPDPSDADRCRCRASLSCPCLCRSPPAASPEPPHLNSRTSFAHHHLHRSSRATANSLARIRGGGRRRSHAAGIHLRFWSGAACPRPRLHCKGARARRRSTRGATSGRAAAAARGPASATADRA